MKTLITPLELFNAIKKLDLKWFGHYSDVHLEVVPLSIGLISNYEYKQHVVTFTSSIEGKRYYEIPFLNADFKSRAKNDQSK